MPRGSLLSLALGGLAASATPVEILSGIPEGASVVLDAPDALEEGAPARPAEGGSR